MILTAIEYRRKNLNAYLDNVGIENGAITSHKFYNATGHEEGDNRFKGKPCECYFDLEKLNTPDGYYILREANGHKESRSFLLIKNFQIDKEFNSEAEMLASIEKTLPDLTGSNAQINWGNSIRQKEFEYLWKQGFYGTRESQIKAFEGLPLDAKWWIDNRNTINTEVMKKLHLEYQTPVGSDY